MTCLRSLAAVLVLGLTTLGRAEDFDRLEGRVLAELPGSGQAREHESLSEEEIGTLPRIFRDERASVVVVKTSEGNPARMLVSLGFRKPSTEEGEPVPILVLERFDTFEAGPATSKLARGRDLMLFPGFLFDLDTGQVVPEDQGADLQFETDGKGHSRLKALAPAKLYTLAKSPLSDDDEPGRPSRGRTVLPTDFSGRYRLVANGQWSGTLEIRSDEKGEIQGRFRSDETGSSYPVRGQVEPGARNLVRFSVVFPRSRMEFDGRLWTEGKGAMAGSMSLLDRTYGFFAVREGASFAPEEVQIFGKGAEGLAGAGHVVGLRANGSVSLDGEELARDGLGSRLGALLEEDKGLSVLLRAAAEQPYREVAEVLGLLKEAGVKDIRLQVGPEGPEEEAEKP